MRVRGPHERIAPALQPLFELPQRPNSSVGIFEGASVRALWLGPDRWLLLCPTEQTAELADSINRSLGAWTHLLSDVSDARCGFSLVGAQAREWLSRLVSIDLHPTVFPPASCALTRLVRIPVLLVLIADPPQDGPEFHLYVDRSLSHYAHAWLLDACESPADIQPRGETGG